MFTDIVDSTQFSVDAGAESARSFWLRHDHLARALIQSFHGLEVGRSDGFLILFERATDGANFARAYHQMLAGGDVPAAARIGAHWGRVTLRRNRPTDVDHGATPFEVEAIAVPTAARVMSAARGGQALFTAAAIDALQNEEVSGPGDFDRSRHGFWRLKGLAEPIELVEIALPGQAKPPPEDSAKAYRVTLRGGEWIPSRELPGTPVQELDEFVGREAELRELARLWECGHRLVTLFGPGGVGKTRFSQHYARLWRGEFSGGVWFCDLSAARSIDGIVHAVGQALDVPMGRNDPVQQIGSAIEARKGCLLILDNFEQVTSCAEATISVWLRAAPQSRILVTTRETLSVAGEHVLAMEPLSAHEAISLFHKRARDRGSDLDPDDRATKRLVELLDCLPLAVELAAARTRTLSPEEQLARIGDRFRLLAARGGRPDRHMTLKATIEWSWDLLNTSEQDAFAQLSVFEGGFTLEAAESVVALPESSHPVWLTDVFQGLLQKSLVRRSVSGRWSMLRSVQEFASERLAATGNGAAQRHWQYFSALPESKAIADHCVELDNLAIACRRATGAACMDEDVNEAILLEASRCLANAWSVLRLVGPFRTGQELAEPLLRVPRLPSAAKARILRVLGAASSLLGQLDAAARYYEEGITAASLAADSSQRALLQAMYGELCAGRGQLEKAEALIRLALSDSGGDDLPRIAALNALGALALARSQPAEAEQSFLKALSLAERHADNRWAGGLHGSLGVALMATGRYAEALPHVEAARSYAESMADRQWASIARCNLGLLLRALGQLEAAAAELQFVIVNAREMAHSRLQTTALCNLGLVELARERPDAAAQALREATKTADGLNATRLAVQCRAYLAQALVSSGDPASAITILDEAIRLAGEKPDASLDVLLLAERSLAAQALGRSSEARQLLRQAEHICARRDDVDSESIEALQYANRHSQSA